MKEPYAVFHHGDKELLAYTLRGTFAGEKDATIELLAGERGIPGNEITVTVEKR